MKYLLFLLFPALLSAQNNIRQAENYLGQIRFNQVAPPAGPVHFIFSQQTLSRTADGKATYRTLLQKGYFSDAANYGSLSAVVITENGKPATVARYTPATDETGMLSRADASTAKQTSWTLPDSARLADRMAESENMVRQWRQKAWAAAAPIWRFIMVIFMSFLPLLIMVGGLLRYVAKTAAGESAVNMWGANVIGGWMLKAHHLSASALLVIKWAVTIVALINVFLYLVWAGLDWWVILVIWFICLWFAEKITNWIVPDVRVIAPRPMQNQYNGPAITAKN